MRALPLERGLEVLGEVLAERDLRADLVLIGGGALLLLGQLERPTGDLDVVARFEDGALQPSEPFPKPLLVAIRRVGAALDLPLTPRDAKDWLNAGPSYLAKMGLPHGFETRLTVKTYGPLTIRIASRRDMIALKIFAATDPSRGARRDVDVADLLRLAPTDDELVDALRWCAHVDGRPDFLHVDVAPLLDKLGIPSNAVLEKLANRSD